MTGFFTWHVILESSIWLHVSVAHFFIFLSSIPLYGGFPDFFFNWRIIALQCCLGFCHKTWTSHNYDFPDFFVWFLVWFHCGERILSIWFQFFKKSTKLTWWTLRVLLETLYFLLLLGGMFYECPSGQWVLFRFITSSLISCVLGFCQLLREEFWDRRL